MANTVRVGIVYTAWGMSNEIDLPDDIDPTSPNAKAEILDYLESIKDDIPLPQDAEYISDSDKLDTNGELQIRLDKPKENQKAYFTIS